MKLKIIADRQFKQAATKYADDLNKNKYKDS